MPTAGGQGDSVETAELAVRGALDVRRHVARYRSVHGDLQASTVRKLRHTHLRLADTVPQAGEERTVVGLTQATTARFTSLVGDVIAPPLKARKYRKRQLVWHRPAAAVWPVVDVQRGRGRVGDHTDFTLNWGLFVPGFGGMAFGTQSASASVIGSPVMGRVGFFSDDPADIWWQIEGGVLGRSFPKGDGGDQAFEEELRALLDRMLDFLDLYPELDSLLELIDRVVSSPNSAPGGAKMVELLGQDVAALVRALNVSQ